jgi:hypothetical protein
VDANVLPRLRADIAFAEITRLSSSAIYSTFHNFDSGYRVFSIRFRYTTNDLRLNSTVFVTNMIQSYWNVTWPRRRHLTGALENGVPFLSYYSAAFADLVTFPYRLRLLDDFDFFARLDLDNPFRRDTPASMGDFLPVCAMVH